MPSLLTLLNTKAAQAFAAAGFDPAYGQVVISERPDLGQFQCNGALACTRSAGQPPRVIAEKVVNELAADKKVFADVSIAGPGFINLTLTDTFLAIHLEQYASQESLANEIPTPERIVIDYGGANIAKPLHVGHLRSGVIGESLKKLYRYLGHTVFGDVHLGDWGTPIGVVIEELRLERPDLSYYDANFIGSYPEESPVTLDDLERLYPRGSARLKEDPEFQRAAQQATAELQAGRAGYLALWQHIVAVSIASLKENYGALEIYFDWWYGESRYNDRIPPLVERLLKTKQAEYSEGAIIIPLHPEDGREMLPLLLAKSDGAYLYATTDLAAVEERVQDDHIDRIVYVVDQRQSLHFAQVFQAARQTEIAPQEIILQHAGFGTVNGTDGKPFKTRAGGVMKLKDLVEMVTRKAQERLEEAGMGGEYPKEEQQEIARQVGVAALKFADLINHRTSDYIFDLDRFVSFEGKTGPYLIYTAVRIKSILRKLGEEAKVTPLFLPPTDPERALVLALTRLPEIITEAYLANAPHFLAEHAFALAQEYNRFYQSCSIVHEKDADRKRHLITLSRTTLRHLETLCQLLAISVPERM